MKGLISNSDSDDPDPSVMASLQPYITSLLKSLPPSPVQQDTLDELVRRALADSKDKSSVENCKSQWEYLLKNEIYLLAVRCHLVLFIATLLIEALSSGNGGKGPSRGGDELL